MKEINREWTVARIWRVYFLAGYSTNANEHYIIHCWRKKKWINIFPKSVNVALTRIWTLLTNYILPADNCHANCTSHNFRYICLFYSYTHYEVYLQLHTSIFSMPFSIDELAHHEVKVFFTCFYYHKLGCRSQHSKPEKISTKLGGQLIQQG